MARQLVCRPAPQGAPGSGCGHHSDGPAFFSLTRVKFENMSFCPGFGQGKRVKTSEKRKRARRQRLKCDRRFHPLKSGRRWRALNLRNFGNLTAIKEKAEAFSENRCQVTRSHQAHLRHSTIRARILATPSCGSRPSGKGGLQAASCRHHRLALNEETKFMNQPGNTIAIAIAICSLRMPSPSPRLGPHTPFT